MEDRYARGQILGAGARAVLQGGGGEWGGIGAIASQADAKRQPELVVELDRMERVITGLDLLLEQLAMRLDGGALRASEPANATEQGVESRPSSGYASTLYAQSARVSRFADRVQDLLRRLEV